MSEYDVLLVGESWVSLDFEIKGRDVVGDAGYEEAGAYLIAALESAGSEERRVGKECSEPCRSRWSPYH